MADPGPRRLTRRRALAGAGSLVAGLGVTGGIVFGPRAVDRLTRDCGPSGRVPRAGGWTVDAGAFSSRTVPATVGYAVAAPPGAPPELPVVVCLPGRGGRGEEWLRRLRLHDVAAELVRSGGPPFAVAAVDGGESYWHPRASGEDRMRMLIDEFLPLLADRGLGRTSAGRFLLGWSMGGFGALLAAIEAPGEFARVSVASPAVWTSAGDTAAGAFDDADDYRRHDVVRRADELAIPVQLFCGTSDPFHDASRKLVRRIGPDRVTASFEPGCHDDAYWRRVAPGQLRWLTGRST